MLENISVLEWIGYAASVVVAVSLMMVSILKLRWFNLLGSSIFSFYGFAIAAYPVGILNLFIALVNIYYLRAMYGKKDAFKIISISNESPYLSYFLNFYRQEIIKFFPSADALIHKILNSQKNGVNLIILRNAAVAGIFVGEKNQDTIMVDLDFVIPEFRDLKPGQFLFGDTHDTFKNLSVSKIQTNALSHLHVKYLGRVGFKEKISAAGDTIYEKIL